MKPELEPNQTTTSGSAGSLERMVRRLRRCPFCGHEKAKMEWEPVQPIFEDDKTRNWFVECQKCGAQGPCSNREDKARDYWHQRNYEKPVLERPFLRPHDDFGSKMDGAW